MRLLPIQQTAPLVECATGARAKAARAGRPAVGKKPVRHFRDERIYLLPLSGSEDLSVRFILANIWRSPTAPDGLPRGLSKSFPELFRKPRWRRKAGLKGNLADADR
ncbi:hypothetical protein LMG27198_12010 [Methylocystis echinoides]|uniref:Uncharacterized protein n=1 Tax=Methylocystis echinoides TaxID=29468 RepID=A0A9W6GSP1_9HYPH|nr:hypothetical protein LMG27198_12010 [Methylocystis echinoides]